MGKITVGFLLAVVVVIGVLWWSRYNDMDQSTKSTDRAATPAGLKTAVMAGGCFWCVESDLQKIPEVESVVSGYSGGTTENPTYKNYAAGGHREVVEVTYDSTKVSYEQLVRHFLRHIDPTDPAGSFGDRGVQYSPAIYYETEEEQAIAERVLKELEEQSVFGEPLAVPVLPRQTFWPAEEYHQDYADKNPVRYKLYRTASGRDRFIERHWEDSK